MRTKTAKRRGMPLDEGIITKLVIFERCAGAEATSDLYRLIDAEAGKPKILKGLETLDGEQLPSGLPKSWERNSDFIQKWSKLKPELQSVDLRAAVYLSRETMPIGVYAIGLSPDAREALETLVKTKNISSTAAKDALRMLPVAEQVPVMEGLISHLRQTSDWTKQPDGFAGACLLADSSPEAAKFLSRYIHSFDDQKPWMKASLKDKQWYKGI